VFGAEKTLRVPRLADLRRLQGQRLEERRAARDLQRMPRQRPAALSAGPVQHRQDLRAVPGPGYGADAIPCRKCAVPAAVARSTRSACASRRRRHRLAAEAARRRRDGTTADRRRSVRRRARPRAPAVRARRQRHRLRRADRLHQAALGHEIDVPTRTAR
jgi:hypothetical protein